MTDRELEINIWLTAKQYDEVHAGTPLDSDAIGKILSLVRSQCCDPRRQLLGVPCSKALFLKGTESPGNLDKYHARCDGFDGQCECACHE